MLCLLTSKRQRDMQKEGKEVSKSAIPGMQHAMQCWWRILKSFPDQRSNPNHQSDCILHKTLFKEGNKVMMCRVKVVEHWKRNSFYLNYSCFCQNKVFFMLNHWICSTAIVWWISLKPRVSFSEWFRHAIVSSCPSQKRPKMRQ